MSTAQLDVLGLGDGQTCDIAEVVEDNLKPLVELAFEGFTAADVPGVYTHFKTAEWG
jgi:hypothetical protein